MGKKRNVTTETKGHIARNNAQVLAQAFRQVGLNCAVYDDTPCWGNNPTMPHTITAVTLCDITDPDGNCYEICFSHATGKPMIDADYPRHW